MRTLLIGAAAGILALGASAMPASADLDDDLYSVIDDGLIGVGTFEYFQQLVDVAGYDTQFDVPDNVILGDLCSNGGAMYTVFAPLDNMGIWVGALEDLLDKTWAQILATPGLPALIVNDHVINNSVSIAEMENPTLQQLVARSGFLISVTSPTGATRVVLNDASSVPELAGGGNVSAAGRSVYWGEQACNGHLYAIGQPFSSTKKVTTEGLGPEDSPKDGTPGGTNSLPNTL